MDNNFRNFWISVGVCVFFTGWGFGLIPSIAVAAGFVAVVCAVSEIQDFIRNEYGRCK